MRSLILCGLGMISVIVVSNLGGGAAHAFTQYSQNGDATNCAQSGCHGDFRASNYMSPSDGMDWGNLHNLHRFDMLSGDCDACHIGSNRLPVNLASSEGGDGLSAIGCMGCHGRNADNSGGNPSSPDGLGAGLRQHHHNAGTTICANCHDDADPANYTPVDEPTLPDYYENPGANHPAMPVASCNNDTSENFAGSADGLDNDGNGDYDMNDTVCIQTPVEEQSWGRVKAMYR